MAETGVWAPCVLLAHASSTASSTVDADLMVTDSDRVVVDKKLSSAVWYLRLPPKKSRLWRIQHRVADSVTVQLCHS